MPQRAGFCVDRSLVELVEPARDSNHPLAIPLIRVADAIELVWAGSANDRPVVHAYGREMDLNCIPKPPALLFAAARETCGFRPERRSLVARHFVLRARIAWHGSVATRRTGGNRPRILGRQGHIDV